MLAKRLGPIDRTFVLRHNPHDERPPAAYDGGIFSEDAI
jgi:hypothetical protein